ncbi:MAG: hypothetical protein H0W22_04780, partial [Chloroflexi bacterium]|nr:hypothetical protein [Chloroflexota bacterium]
MDDRPPSQSEPGVTRLGPDSGGRVPPSGSGRGYTWEWGPDAAPRPGLPWIGVFLLVFGGLLLAREVFPEARSLGSLVTLAVGIAFLIKWAVDRGTGSLYAGAIITALAVPGVLTDAGVALDGLGTFCFGIAFLFIAAVRAASGGGIGWQAWFGGLLALLGGVNMLSPQVGGLVVPVALVALGAVLVFGGA